MENEAIGQFEAAALMGVHFSRPAKMAKERVLTAHTLRIHKDRTYCFYERRQCEENWQRYTEDRFGRPRQGIEKRYEILRMLSDESRPRIEVDDAICTHEAAGILDCYPTLIPRLAESGKIVGRRLLSLRTGDPRLWIYSRKSCLAHKET